MKGFTSRRRAPARIRRISEIKTGDEQVQVTGLVVDKKEANLILDDGTGRIAVLFEGSGIAKDVNVSSTIRVFGTPLNIQGGHEIHADIIQKLDGLNLKLYRRTKHEVKKFEKELEQHMQGVRLHESSNE